MEPKAAFWFNEACSNTRAAFHYANNPPQSRPPAGYGAWRDAAMNAAKVCLLQAQCDRARASVAIPG